MPAGQSINTNSKRSSSIRRSFSCVGGNPLGACADCGLASSERLGLLLVFDQGLLQPAALAPATSWAVYTMRVFQAQQQIQVAQPKSASSTAVLAPCLARGDAQIGGQGGLADPTFFQEQIRSFAAQSGCSRRCLGWGRLSPAARSPWAGIRCGSRIDQTASLAQAGGRGITWGLSGPRRGRGRFFPQLQRGSSRATIRALHSPRQGRRGQCPQPAPASQRCPAALGPPRPDSHHEAQQRSLHLEVIAGAQCARRWYGQAGQAGLLAVAMVLPAKRSCCYWRRFGRGRSASCAGGDPQGPPPHQGFRFSAFHADQGQALPLQARCGQKGGALQLGKGEPASGWHARSRPAGVGVLPPGSWRARRLQAPILDGVHSAAQVRDRPGRCRRKKKRSHRPHRRRPIREDANGFRPASRFRCFALEGTPTSAGGGSTRPVRRGCSQAGHQVGGWSPEALGCDSTIPQLRPPL